MKNKKKNKSSLLLFLLLSFSAFAGNGSSGGGHIHADGVNPWFLQNTTKINYCIEKSSDFAFISKDKLNDLIRDSFRFWKKQFNKKNLEPINLFFTPLSPRPLIATQKNNFSHDCSKVDVTFLFGKLSAERKKLLGDLKNTIGIAYRESYDEVNLRGKGFIYIAPDSGPNKPKSKNFLQNAWKKNDHLLLRMAIYHEVGHIYGIQDSTFGPFDLMSKDFLEYATSRRSPFTLGDLKLKHVDKFFKPLGFGIRPEYHTFANDGFVLYSTPNHKMVRKALYFDEKQYNNLMIKGKGRTIEIYQVQIDDDENEDGVDEILKTQQIGNITLPELHSDMFRTHQHAESAINLWLPATQKVFTHKVEFKKKNKIGIVVKKKIVDFSETHAEFLNETSIGIIPIKRQIVMNNLTLKLINGEEIKVNVQMKVGQQPSISAIIDNVYYEDILNNVEFINQNK